jgi:site-specific DNA-methyltransferase (adenine-specific)
MDFETNLKFLEALGGDASKKQMQTENSLAEAVKIKEPFTKVGDIWQLGRHKLAVGSSAERPLLEKLIGDTKVDMIFTDPPYDLPNEFLLQIFRNVQDLADLHFWMMSDRQAVYLCSRQIEFSKFFIQDFVMGTMIASDQPITRHNLIAQFGKRPCHNLRDAFSTIVTVPTLRLSKEHQVFSMGKNPELPETFIRHFQGDKDKVILDLFGGSGSTMIAAENIGKACYLVEIEPLYASLIIQRWANYTHLEPKIIS